VHEYEGMRLRAANWKISSCMMALFDLRQKAFQLERLDT
tara:strand:+ start:803 stop:919 length:117 start_codon:yes stop_codon:yes gene_type:complete